MILFLDKTSKTSPLAFFLVAIYMLKDDESIAIFIRRYLRNVY